MRGKVAPAVGLEPTTKRLTDSRSASQKTPIDRHRDTHGGQDIRLNKAKIARQCACRGWLIGFEQPHANNALTVEAHQQTEAHRSWDLKEWQERNTAKGEVPIAVLRKVS